MKVLQVLPELNAGGVERTTLEIAEALVKAGFIPHICSNGGRLVEPLENLGAVHHKHKIGSKNPLNLRANTKKLIDIIKSENIDIVHARSRAPAWPAHAAAKATNRHFVTTYHGIYKAKSRAKKRYNAIMAKGERVITNSEFTKLHVLSEHNIDPNIITVIPRGVDMELFNPSVIDHEKVADLRRLWRVTPGEKAVLLPGRITSWKGQMLAVEALAACPDNVKLILMGDPQGRTKFLAKLIQTARDLGVGDRVRLPGHSSDVPLALMAADLVIAPSIEPEAFGRVVAEAQAMERFVIASNHGGPVETVISGKTGQLVEPGDAKALANAIHTALETPYSNGSFARSHILENFSKSQLQRKTLDVYKNILM